MPVERRDEAFEADVRLTVLGAKLAVGEFAPEFELEELAPGAPFPTPVTLGESAGCVRILHIINSVDTPICHAGACQWDVRLGNAAPDGVRLFTVSMDLPFAQIRWRNSIQGEHRLLSSHRSERFGVEYGVLLAEWRLLQRAVIVIGRDDRVLHAEYVADQMDQVDFATAIGAARRGALQPRPRPSGATALA